MKVDSFDINIKSILFGSDEITLSICSLVSLLGGQSSYHKESDSFRSNILDELKILTDSIAKGITY